MTPWDWTPYLTGGATRPDAMSGLDQAFQDALIQMLTAAPEDIRSGLRIMSGYRSPEVQAQLYARALEQHGSEAAARRWVAPPGRSQHNFGRAVDFTYGNDAVRQWVHANAQNFGLHFPMSWEPWHIEPVGARNGQMPAASGGRNTGNAPAPAPGSPGMALGNMPTLPGFMGGTPAPNPFMQQQNPSPQQQNFMDMLVGVELEQQRNLEAAKRPPGLAQLDELTRSGRPAARRGGYNVSRLA
jgi:hypothetical protein